MYFIVFKLFNQAWVDQKPGIMKFTQFLHVIYEEQFVDKIHDIIDEYCHQLNESNKQKYLAQQTKTKWK